MMRYRKGQIGQIITSFPALLLVFVIMLLFFVFSSAMSIGVKKEVSGTRTVAEPLMELFLEDSITVAGEERNVRDWLVIAANEKTTKQLTMLTSVEKKFNDVYSCGKKNTL